MDSTNVVQSNQNKRKYEINDDTNDSTVHISSSNNNAININIDEPVLNVHQNEPNAIDVTDLLPPPELNSPSHILMALNDHCLYEVFNRLHILDLTNAAKVCVQFQSQAKKVFSSKYKHLMLNHEEMDHDQMASILCEFGSLIQSLCIQSNQHAADGVLFHAIIHNCTPDLKALRLIRMKIQVESPDVRLPFPKLEALEIEYCEGNLSLAHLIDDCPELTKINVSYGYLRGLAGLISRKFKKLKELHLHGKYSDINDHVLNDFIASNPTMNELDISGHPGLVLSHTIRLIGQHMLALKTLFFKLPIDILDDFYENIQLIGNLRSLKCLRMHFNGMDVEAFAELLVTKNLPIEDLGIWDGSIDDIAIKWILRLKQMNKLRIYWIAGMDDDKLIRLAKNLTELQEFHFSAKNGTVTIDAIIKVVQYAKKMLIFRLKLSGAASEVIIDSNHYEIMLNMIRGRPEKIGLDFRISGNKIKINVPQRILKENQDILFIERC